VTTTSNEHSALGIRFRPNGQLYYFTSKGLDAKVGDQVVVETDQGMGLGTVAIVCEGSPETLGDEELKPIERLATEEDLASQEENIAMAKDAFAYCKRCIRERDLDMKLVDVEVFFDRSKIIFYFTAPTRIDFRELVKDLVKNYRTRIELRQIGVRHETQMIGALGNCGMVCCCRRYLRKFAPVTIKMAKEQNLFLNPNKISGMCGRLLCCLNYEQSNYEEFHRRCPKMGKKFVTSLGPVKVIRANMFRNAITLLLETNEEKEVSLEEWLEMNPRRPDQVPVTEQATPQEPEARKIPDIGLESGQEQPRESRNKPRQDSRVPAGGAEARPEARPEARQDAEPRRERREQPAQEIRPERRKESRNEPRKEVKTPIFLPLPEELEDFEEVDDLVREDLEAGPAQDDTQTATPVGENKPQKTGKNRRRRKRKPKAKS